MNLYLAVISVLMGLIALYTINKSIRLETNVLNSLKKIEKKLNL